MLVVLRLNVYAQLTPQQSLGLQPIQVEIPAIFKPTLPGNYIVNLPSGWGARIFYAGGLLKPRFLAIDKNGVLHVADYNNGKVFAMPDNNRNGIADTIFVAAENFTLSHDVKFYDGNMYVTEERKVWKLTDANDDGVYEQREIFIDSIAEGAAQPGGGHRTRTIVFDSVNQKVYLSIGSLCNVCREDKRAIIEQYNMDGTGKRTYASGIRNAVGLTIHPVTNNLWANNNGSDRQGSQIPPEWIDIIREGGFYGYPFAYGNKTYFNFMTHPDYQALLPITASDSAKVNQMVFPAAHVEAHSAPMALMFLNNRFPPSMQHGLITALRGSWDSPKDYRGYMLSYIHFDSPTDTSANFTADFCTGFLTDTVNRVFWARPVGLALGSNGSIFMSSDEGNRFIMELYQTRSTGMIQQKAPQRLSIFPNPATKYLVVNTSATIIETIEIINLMGKKQDVETASENHQLKVDTSKLLKGIYVCKIKESNGIEHVVKFFVN